MTRHLCSMADAHLPWVTRAALRLASVFDAALSRVSEYRAPAAPDTQTLSTAGGRSAAARRSEREWIATALRPQVFRRGDAPDDEHEESPAAALLIVAEAVHLQ
jgi:hypothetical protein